MNILFVGNVCNFAYWFAKWGRELGFDTHALIEDDTPYPRDYPEWEDPAYDAVKPPEWVHFYRAGSPLRRATGMGIDPRLARLVERADAVQTFSPAAAILVDLLGHEQVHHTIGSFARTSRWLGGSTVRRAISPKRIPTTVRFRRAMHAARRIIVSTAVDHAEVAAGSFRSKMVGLPIPYDVDQAGGYALGRSEGGRHGSLRFVMPARQHWDFKGQDTVLRAMAELTDEERRRTELVLFDWGPDAARSKELAALMGLGETVRFAPMLPKHDLWRELSRADVVVVDQVPHLDFKGGALGGVARDALSVGAPVITHAAPNVQTRIHRTPPPVLHVEQSVASVRDRMRECLSLSSRDLAELGAAGRAWLAEECHYEQVVPRYVDVHERLALTTRSQGRQP